MGGVTPVTGSYPKETSDGSERLSPTESQSGMREVGDSSVNDSTLNPVVVRRVRRRARRHPSDWTGRAAVPSFAETRAKWREAEAILHQRTGSDRCLLVAGQGDRTDCCRPEWDEAHWS